MIETAPRKRRRLALSVKMLMLLMLPVAIWLGWVTNKARRQRQAVEAIQKHGGSVYYNWEIVDGVYSPGRKPTAPEWFRRLAGDEYFQEVETVLFRRPDDGDVTDSLAGMSHLRSLEIEEGYVTETGFQRIGGLASLSSLHIKGTRGLTDSGAGHLANLRDLKYLLIADSELSDTGLGHLAALTKLEMLTLMNLKNRDIAQSRITDRGLEHLKALTRLRSLYVIGIGVTEDGVSRLQQALPSLKTVRRW